MSGQHHVLVGPLQYLSKSGSLHYLPLRIVCPELSHRTDVYQKGNEYPGR